MNITITATAIATLISSFIATTVALRISKTNRVRELQSQLDRIIKIAIQYPYLEDSGFTNTWVTNKSYEDEKYLRYEMYCTLLFNYLERFCSFYNYDKSEITKHLNVRDWVRTHRQCWEHPSIPFENADGYNENFKNLVKAYLE